MKKCAFIGNLEITFDDTLETKNKLENLLKGIIFKQGFNHFILSSLKGFNGIAHMLLYGYVQKGLEITLSNIFDYKNFLFGESVPFNVKLEYIYRLLIDNSDLIIFGLHKNSEREVFLAYEYAKSKNKQTIILE